MSDTFAPPNRPAHIIYPPVEAGHKALALCGTKLKVKYDDLHISDEHYTCRDCVGAAIELLSEAATIAELARQTGLLVRQLADSVVKDQDDSMLTAVIESADDYQAVQARKAGERALAEKAKADAKASKKSKKKGKSKKDDRPPIAPEL